MREKDDGGFACGCGLIPRMLPSVEPGESEFSSQLRLCCREIIRRLSLLLAQRAAYCFGNMGKFRGIVQLNTGDANGRVSHVDERVSLQ